MSSVPGEGSEATPRFRPPFHQIARFAGWVPASFIGIGPLKFHASQRSPVLAIQSEPHAQEVCKTLNHRLDNQVFSPRFGWLPAQAFPLHERLDIEASIRKAQAGLLTGVAAESVHMVAREAAIVAEALEKMIDRGDVPELGSGKSPVGTCYVFARWFFGLREPCPLERYVVLPDAEVEATIEADAQEWAKENWSTVVEKLQAQSRRRLGTPNAKSGSTDDELAKCLNAVRMSKESTPDQLVAILESHFPTKLGAQPNPPPAGPGEAGDQKTDASEDRGPETPVAGAAQPEPAAQSQHVKLYGPADRPVVCGEYKEPLTKAQYDVVRALIDSADNGLTKDQLDAESRHGDARKIMKRLADSDPGWKTVLVFPGKSGGRYRTK